MLRLHDEGRRGTEIQREYAAMFQGGMLALERSRGIQAQLLPYQAMALYGLAQQYNRKGAEILEIGTFAGYSASIMAQAAPLANIITLNPVQHEAKTAKENLKAYPNVSQKRRLSWTYLEKYTGPELDMIFVDGDHKQCARDVPWFNHLKDGGLILFHDYTLVGSPHVVEAVDAMWIQLDRKPDVLIQDLRGIGIAGFYRMEGEKV